MSYDTITVTPSSPHIGAEIGKIDLTRPLSNRQVQELHDAIIAHGVIFFRDQKIDFESHERLVRSFGEPHIHVGGEGTASKGVAGHPAFANNISTPVEARVGRRMALGPELCRDPADVQHPLSGAGPAKWRR